VGRQTDGGESGWCVWSAAVAKGRRCREANTICSSNLSNSVTVVWRSFSQRCSPRVNVQHVCDLCMHLCYCYFVESWQHVPGDIITTMLYYGSYLSFCACWSVGSAVQVVKTVEMMLIDSAGSGRRPPACIIPSAKPSRRLWAIKRCW
jgi:hypothetical protein